MDYDVDDNAAPSLHPHPSSQNFDERPSSATSMDPSSQSSSRPRSTSEITEKPPARMLSVDRPLPAPPSNVVPSLLDPSQRFTSPLPSSARDSIQRPATALTTTTYSQEPFTYTHPQSNPPQSQSPFHSRPHSHSGHEHNNGHLEAPSPIDATTRRRTTLRVNSTGGDGMVLGGDLGRGPSRASHIDWVVPVKEFAGPLSVSERLKPTLQTARTRQKSYAARSALHSLTLNISIGLQVLIGALITGLAAITTGRQTSIVTSVLGGCSTLVASYLAKARGSGEPEISRGRSRDLEKLIRDMEAFILDFGHERPQISFSTFTSSTSFKYTTSPTSATPNHTSNRNSVQPQPHANPTPQSNNNTNPTSANSIGNANTNTNDAQDSAAAAQAAALAAQELAKAAAEAAEAQRQEDFTTLKDRWLEARVEAFREEFEELERGYHGNKMPSPGGA
ncbi:hypothetical protein SISNIDRAFT_460476 [Sistotremastrum niveocremeum HHB9708]|uniref:SMODS and SLOG-associating 2TM effector domain-containing protein n=1 Tax=Sistotremastrum niveocremeum HHB9708 TaxID=1314777 RepID=A0A164NN89_9AGAM|nr:hypothetical protein SISNIDRAFT_460476 [Sistotremastrum niveocremeum HHB9708]